MDEELITYTFHWHGGRDEKLTGTSAADALNRAGYGRGALAALDYYEHEYEDNVFYGDAKNL